MDSESVQLVRGKHGVSKRLSSIPARGGGDGGGGFLNLGCEERQWQLQPGSTLAIAFDLGVDIHFPDTLPWTSVFLSCCLFRFGFGVSSSPDFVLFPSCPAWNPASAASVSGKQKHGFQKDSHPLCLISLKRQRTKTVGTCVLKMQTSFRLV